MAPVARLSVRANGEAPRSGASSGALSAPELALRMLDELEAGSALYVADRQGSIVGFALAGELMVADGGHVVELRRLYVVPALRRRGVGRQLLRLLLDDLRQVLRPGLRAWAAKGSDAARFLQAAGGRPVRERWKVVAGDLAVRGTVFGWDPEDDAFPESRLAT